MLNPRVFEDLAIEADQLGYSTAWMPEHLVFPTNMTGSPHPGQDTPPVPPSTPVFDVFAMLSYLAGRTERIRLGTNVYLLGLRHPFVAARAIVTLDAVSNGRADVGVGAGWLRTEWDATGMDPSTRGRRLDESLSICRRLFTQDTITHKGEFYRFEEVMFEPKPTQSPHPPILIGGESKPALRRAARMGDGWIGMLNTPETARKRIEELGSLRREYGTDGQAFRFITGATVTRREELTQFEDAGVTDLIVRPFAGAHDAVDGVRRFADQCFR
jgi:probable F420-dependent oxidoreductase